MCTCMKICVANVGPQFIGRTACLLQEHAITSDDALALGDLPEKKTVVTVGAGYISLEFASIFHGMGMDTHVLIRKDAPLRG